MIVKQLLEIIQEQQELIDYLLQDDRPEIKEANQRIKDKLEKVWRRIKMKYPRVGEIITVRPQGLCAICGEVLQDGKRPEKRVHVQHNYFRGDDSVFKAHGACIQQVGKRLLDILLTEIFR
jgi:hypothetical protein